ncbi:MAG: hypothetical protein AAF297_04650 [Planctomycetota bacterium]
MVDGGFIEKFRVPRVSFAVVGGLLALGGVGWVSGCASASGTGPGFALGSRDVGGAYPTAMTQDRVLDIQVSRRGTVLYLTNTTATSFDAGTLWVNRRFSAPMPALALGESIELDLRSFVDEFGERFRAGGFWATRDPDAVVLAQLETGDALLGLVVVENRY